jgi:hypothetical protein
MKIEQKNYQLYNSADIFPDSEVIPMLKISSEFSLNLQQVSTGKTYKLCYYTFIYHNTSKGSSENH